MARSLSSYPPIFAQALARALAEGEFTIPTASPQAMRQQFFAYLRALREAGQEENADAIEILCPKDAPSRVILRDRAQSVLAKEIAAALGQEPSAETDTIFSRLAALPGAGDSTT